MKTKQNESSVVVFAGEEPVCKLLESGSDKELDSPSHISQQKKCQKFWPTKMARKLIVSYY